MVLVLLLLATGTYYCKYFEVVVLPQEILIYFNALPRYGLMLALNLKYESYQNYGTGPNEWDHLYLLVLYHMDTFRYV